MNYKTKNIPSSFRGYNKATVNEILKEKDALLETQRQDIEYLRNELSRFEKNKNEKSQTSE